MMRGLRIPTTRWESLLLFLLAVGVMAEPQTRSERRRPLPTKQPTPPVLQFTSPAEGFPPEVRGATNVRVLEWKFHPGALTDEAETQAREVAVRDARVRRLLGERFAYISADRTGRKTVAATGREAAAPAYLLQLSPERRRACGPHAEAHCSSG